MKEWIPNPPIKFWLRYLWCVWIVKEHDYRDGGDWYVCARCQQVWKMPALR